MKRRKGLGFTSRRAGGGKATPGKEMAGYSKEQLLARLEELQIDFISYTHPPVLTVEAQAKYVGHLGAGISKNLFLKDKKQRYYLISALAGTNVDLKVLSQRLGLGKGGMRMAPGEALLEILKVPLGCVTPFAVVNESAQSVALLLDQGFKAHDCCLFHPLSNDTTISLNARGLDKFLVSIGRTPSYVDLEASPSVGKDQPPDLASLVPSGVPISVDQSGKTVEVPSENNIALKNKPASSASETISHPIDAKQTPEKPKNTSTSLTGVADVRKLVDELIDNTTVAVLSEIAKESAEQQKERLGPILDGVKKHIGPDLENLIMSLKNAAYTEGFHSGIRSVHDIGLQSLSFCR